MSSTSRKVLQLVLRESDKKTVQTYYWQNIISLLFIPIRKPIPGKTVTYSNYFVKNIKNGNICPLLGKIFYSNLTENLRFFTKIAKENPKRVINYQLILGFCGENFYHY